MKEEERKLTKADRLWLVAGVIFLLVFCVTGILLFRYYRQYQKQEAVVSDITALRESDLANRTELPEDNKEYENLWDVPDIDLQLQRNNSRLLEANPEYIAWISIPETNLFYPIVQRDNSYYLYHDFFGGRDSHGTIFMDEACNREDDMILFHGHHMKDGTMFAGLKGYKGKQFRQEHPNIYVDWGMGDEAYEIFAVALIDLTVEDYFAFDKLPGHEEEKKQYLKQLKNHSLWYEEPENTDRQMILLSTCEYGTDEQRLVVAAIKTER